MNEQIQSVVDTLEGIKEVILRIHPAASDVDKLELPLSVVLNSNFPSISKKQIIDFIDIEISRLTNLNTAFSESFLQNIEQLIPYIESELKKLKFFILNQTHSFLIK